MRKGALPLLRVIRERKPLSPGQQTRTTMSPSSFSHRRPGFQLTISGPDFDDQGIAGRWHTASGLFPGVLLKRPNGQVVIGDVLVGKVFLEKLVRKDM